MKTIAYLFLLSSFVALGVASAVCVGMYIEKPSDRGCVESAKKSDEAPAEPLAERPVPPCDTDTEALPGLSPSFCEEISASVAPRILPPPPGPMFAASEPSYAQEVVPVPHGEAMPKVLEALRKSLTPQKPPAAAPSPARTRPTTTVSDDGDGKICIRIHDEDVRKVLDLLSEHGDMNILASKNVQGNVSATLNDVTVESALKAILMSTGFITRSVGNIIFVGTPKDFDNIEQAMDSVATRTYQPNYITAAELKALIEPLLTERVGVISVSSPAESGIALDDATAGGNCFSGNDIVVIRDYMAVLSEIDQMVAEVDIRPMQVSIEAMILSVKLQDHDNIGVNFQLLRQIPSIKFGLGSPVSSLADFDFDGGLKFGFLDGNLGAFIEALEQVGDTNVIANPRLMVLNKQRAQIQIGEKKGYISQTITETTSTQSVEFLELGAQLRLRPFISTDGMIRMEVHPELSDGDVKVDPSGITLPNKELTGVTTNIMVRDGCTVVIGGLIREQLTNTTTQVPVLGNLPFVGVAFRQTKETTERREVVILITPRIIYDPETCREGKQTKCEFYRRQSTYAEKMSIFGKRSIARRYYRLADKAYAAGDIRKALRFAEMSVQFDPLNRAALELRSDIWLNKPYQPRGKFVPDEVPLLNPLDGEVMPDWLIDDLENAPPTPAMPLHPLDPGVPGQSSDLVRPKVLK